MQNRRRARPPASIAGGCDKLLQAWENAGTEPGPDAVTQPL